MRGIVALYGHDPTLDPDEERYASNARVQAIWDGAASVAWATLAALPEADIEVLPDPNDPDDVPTEAIADPMGVGARGPTPSADPPASAQPLPQRLYLPHPLGDQRPAPANHPAHITRP